MSIVRRISRRIVSVSRDENVWERLLAKARKALAVEMFGLDGKSVDRIIDAVVTLMREKRPAGKEKN